MRRIRILEEAAEEALEAAAWYESQRQGLGQAFSRVIEDTLDLLTTEQDTIVVVAFAHHSRRPGYWRDRRRT